MDSLPPISFWAERTSPRQGPLELNNSSRRGGRSDAPRVGDRNRHEPLPATAEVGGNGPTVDVMPEPDAPECDLTVASTIAISVEKNPDLRALFVAEVAKPNGNNTVVTWFVVFADPNPIDSELANAFVLVGIE